LEHYLFWHRWGFWHGVLSQLFVMHAVTSNYYFTLALMNHNAEHTHNIKERNAAKDWGYAQLQSSADWGVHLTFIQAGMYIWLNFHTVHHSKSVRSLLPAVRRTCSRLTILFKLAMMFSVSSRWLFTSSGDPRHSDPDMCRVWHQVFRWNGAFCLQRNDYIFCDSSISHARDNGIRWRSLIGMLNEY
jgi:hypothetical protein